MPFLKRSTLAAKQVVDLAPQSKKRISENPFSAWFFLRFLEEENSPPFLSESMNARRRPALPAFHQNPVPNGLHFASGDEPLCVQTLVYRRIFLGYTGGAAHPVIALRYLPANKSLFRSAR